MKEIYSVIIIGFILFMFLSIMKQRKEDYQNKREFYKNHKNR